MNALQHEAASNLEVQQGRNSPKQDASKFSKTEAKLMIQLTSSKNHIFFQPSIIELPLHLSCTLETIGDLCRTQLIFILGGTAPAAAIAAALGRAARGCALLQPAPSAAIGRGECSRLRRLKQSPT